MTNQKHPITPPLEMVEQWADMLSSRSDHAVFSLAAQWGSDQELEACCEWLVSKLTFREDGIRFADELRAARRLKPPSLKEQAYAALDTYIYGNPDHGNKQSTYNTIRRALEALPND